VRKKGKGGGRNWATEQRAEAGKTGRRGREGRLGRFLVGLKRWEGRFFKNPFSFLNSNNFKYEPNRV